MMETNDALIAVISRNAFYRRLHYLALGLLALMVVVIGILICVLIYLTKNPSKPLYFATDTVGRLIHITPLTQPNMSNDELSAWVVEAAQAAYSYDYLNYRSQLQNAQKYFTNYGWSKYMQALQASNNLNGVIQRQWIGLAKVIEPPKIETEGMLSGAYAWKFKVMMLVTYLRPPQYDQATMRADPIQLSIIVQRQPILQSYKGVGIVQMVGTLVTDDSYNQMQQPPITNAPTG